MREPPAFLTRGVTRASLISLGMDKFAPMKIQLIGRPTITSDQGEDQPVRGHQAWAVLARVLLSPSPLDRRILANDLFPEAEDPLGALRWCLANLRRALNESQALSGDPVIANLPSGTSVDVLDLHARPFGDERVGELLEGIEPRSSPQFSTWLLIERARVAGLVNEKLRKEALQSLASKDYTRAVRLAEQVARRNLFDESAQILLVKTLVDAGLCDAAAAHVEGTERLYLEEVGEKPSPALRGALKRRMNLGDHPSSSTATRSMVEAGRAAVQAGAVDSGLELLRRAAAEAEALHDHQLQAEAVLELGSALVHSVRGYDDEGSILLGQALVLARCSGDGETAATALCELGYVDAMAGRRPSAADHLKAALELAIPAQKVARIQAVMGFNLIDWGRFESGLTHYDQALESARQEQDYRTEIWAFGVGSWGHLAAGRPETAMAWLYRCLEKVDQANWLAFRPFPMALQCEAKMLLGQDPEPLRPELERAFALSCQMCDPCWEAAVARTIGLTFAAVQDFESALGWLANAQKRCTREPDTFVALHLQILADRANMSRRLGHLSQAEWMTRELLSLAARTHADHQVQQAIDNLSFNNAYSPKLQ
jgi:tetratricopeptide (TPR) repeat protein